MNYIMRQTQKNRTKIAIEWGFKLTTNFYSLSWDEITKLEDLRKTCGYRGNNTLGRSKARQFWYYLQKGNEELKKEA